MTGWLISSDPNHVSPSSGSYQAIPFVETGKWLISNDPTTTNRRVAHINRSRGGSNQPIPNTWDTRFRGTFLVHASSRRYSAAQLADAREEISEKSGIAQADIPDPFPSSSLIGAVDLVDCVSGHASPWAYAEQVHWVLEHPPLAEPIADFGGKLGLWKWTCP